MKDKKEILTIAIPTYNRPSQLRETLKRILPQVLSEERVVLKILDNCSEIPAEDILKSLLPQPHARIEIIRHRANIGGNANILRCFEVSNTKWLWCLGDDDLPSETAVRTILQTVENVGDKYVHIYFAVSNLNQPKFQKGDGSTVVCSTVEEWETRLPFPDNLFISSSLYNQDLCLPFLLQGYWAMEACSAQLALVFSAFVSGHGKILLSRESIVKHQKPAGGTNYSWITGAYGALLLERCWIKGTRQEDRKRVFRYSNAISPAPGTLLFHLLSEAGDLRRSDIILQFRIFKNVYGPSISEGVCIWCKWQICTFWSHFPKTFLWLVDKYAGNRKKALDYSYDRSF